MTPFLFLIDHYDIAAYNLILNGAIVALLAINGLLTLKLYLTLKKAIDEEEEEKENE
jgi:hypothetical protein